MAEKNNDRKQRGKNIAEVVFPVADTTLNLPVGYADFITRISLRMDEKFGLQTASAAANILV